VATLSPTRKGDSVAVYALPITTLAIPIGAAFVRHGADLGRYTGMGFARLAEHTLELKDRRFERHSAFL
jgi:hypothetical protein